MSFVWPQYLWLLLVVPVLVAAYVALLRRKKIAVRYANLGLVKAAISPTQRFRRHVPPLLFLLAIIGALVAVARPSADRDAAVRRADDHPRDGRLAVDARHRRRAQPDRRGAERGQGVRQGPAARHPRRHRHVRRHRARSCSRRRRTARTWSRRSTASSCSGIRRSAAASSCRWRRCFPTRASISSIRVRQRLRLARQRAAQRRRTSAEEAEKKPFKPVPPGSYKSAAIILLTDGRRTTGPDPLDAARMAADHGVRVFTVGLRLRGRRRGRHRRHVDLHALRRGNAEGRSRASRRPSTSTRAPRAT